MDDDAAADHGDGAAAQTQTFDDDFIMCVARRIGGKIAEITSVVVFSFGAAMWMFAWIIMTAGRGAVFGADVAEFMQMEGVFAIWSKSADVGNHTHAAFDVGEAHFTGDLISFGRLHHRDEGRRYWARFRDLGCAMFVSTGDRLCIAGRTAFATTSSKADEGGGEQTNKSCGTHGMILKVR